MWSALARRVALHVLVASGPLPGPAAFDLGFQGEAQESADQDDDRQQPNAGEGQWRRDGADDVGADEQFEAKENSSAQVRPIAIVAVSPIMASCAVPQEDAGGHNHTEDVMETPINSSRLASCSM